MVKKPCQLLTKSNDIRASQRNYGIVELNLMEMTHAIVADKANQQHAHSSSFVLLISDFSEWTPVCACSVLALNI